jgi:hypothetical protein
MTYIHYMLAALFLPLFPFSMVLNMLYVRLRNPLLRSLVLLLWPQIGLIIIFFYDLSVSMWVLAWGLATSLLYALRMLALNELGLWTSFVATSSWALLWVLQDNAVAHLQLQLYALGICVPLIMMNLLCAGLESRFGAAYLGLYGGLAQALPRYSSILVLVVLAIDATPLCPTFFAMLSMILKAIPTTPLVAVVVGGVWLLWSWAGARLLQGLIVGPVRVTAPDLSHASLWIYIIALGGLLLSGMYWSELVV